MVTTRNNSKKQTVNQAARGPVWDDADQTDLAVRIVARGDQATRQWHGEDSTGRHIAVTVGRVLVYTYEVETIEAMVLAWQQAHDLRDRVFGAETGQVAPPDRTEQLHRSVGAAALHITGTLRPRVVAENRTTTRTPYIAVHTGPLIVVALDPDAVNRFHLAWRDALLDVAEWLDLANGGKIRDATIDALGRRMEWLQARAY